MTIFYWGILFLVIKDVRLDFADNAVGEPLVPFPIVQEPQLSLITGPIDHIDVKRDSEQPAGPLDSLVPNEHVDTKRSQTDGQLSELITTNEHADVKRSRFDVDDYQDGDEPTYLKRQPYRFRETVPTVLNILSRPTSSIESEQDSYSMTNINDKPDTLPKPFQNRINKPEEPKYLFSSVHMKLYPKIEEAREDAMRRTLQPDIDAGIIGLPELIRDAPSSSSAEFDLGRNNNRPIGLIHIVKTSSSSKTPQEELLSNLDNPIIFEKSAEHSSVEESMGSGRPLLISTKKPSPSKKNTNHSGTIASASGTKKPSLKLGVKSNLRISKIKLAFSTTSKRPLPKTSTEIEDSASSIDVTHKNGDTNQAKPKQATTTTADAKAEPRCPSGGEFLQGTTDLWNEFHDADSWGRSFKAVGNTAVKATKSVGSCFKSIWRGVKGLFGYDEEENQTQPSKPRRAPTMGTTKRTTPRPTAKTTKKPSKKSELTVQGKGLWTKMKEAANTVKEGFNKHIAEPVSSSFNTLAEKTKDAFSKRSTDGDGDEALENPEDVLRVQDKATSTA